MATKQKFKNGNVPTPPTVEDSEAMENNVEELVETPEVEEVKEEKVVKTTAPVVDVEEEKKVKEEQGYVKLNIEQVNNELSVDGQVQFAWFLQYMKDMAPNQVMNVEEGSRHQLKLFQILDSTINQLTARDFNILFRAMLDLFHEHRKGVFSDDYVYRFASDWPMPEEQRNFFKRVLTLMTTTADPKTRYSAIKQITNLNYVFQFGFTNEGRSKVEAFYKI